MTRPFTYRLVSLLVLLALTLGACTTATPTAVVEPTSPPAPSQHRQTGRAHGNCRREAVEQPTEPPAPLYTEAPDLAEKAAAGQLPPVEERLPSNPLVVESAEIGKYGGVWRMGMRGGTDDASFYRILGYETLVRWSPLLGHHHPQPGRELGSERRRYRVHLCRCARASSGPMALNSPPTTSPLVRRCHYEPQPTRWFSRLAHLRR